MKAYKVLFKASNGVLLSVFTIGEHAKKYKIGERVSADPSTLGLFCFDVWENALKFRNQCGYDYFAIFEVDGIGKASYPEKIATIADNEHLHQFYNSIARITDIPPEGTICFPTIKLIKEIT